MLQFKRWKQTETCTKVVGAANTISSGQTSSTDQLSQAGLRQ